MYLRGVYITQCGGDKPSSLLVPHQNACNVEAEPGAQALRGTPMWLAVAQVVEPFSRPSAVCIQPRRSDVTRGPLKPAA